jgi:thiol-disulfide isomerase/thioredoxin
MKSFFKKICLLACVLLLCIACSNREKLLDEKLADNEFLIEGEIFGVKNGTVIELYRYDGSYYPVASDKIRNGRFVFKEKTVSDMERLFINSRDKGFPGMFLSVWVEPGARIKIQGKDKLNPLWEVESSIPYQEEENRYINQSRDLIAEIARVTIERNDLRTKASKAWFQQKALAYKKSAASVAVIQDSLQTQQVFADINIMEETDISPIWLNKMEDMALTVKYPSGLDAEQADYLRKKAEELYGRMSEADKTTPTGYQITANLFPPSIIVEEGDDIADAELFNVNGDTKHISDYLGNYLLLDFWSLGCGPCLRAFPEMKEISETYHDKLTIISISLDTDAVWRKSMAEHDMPWINIHDPKSWGGLAANYGINSIPYYIIISPDGKVINKGSGYFKGALKSRVSEYIK